MRALTAIMPLLVIPQPSSSRRCLQPKRIMVMERIISHWWLWWWCRLLHASLLFAAG
jgi:hypothetical protein